MTTAPGAFKFKPSRHFAKMFVRPDPPPPEPLTTGQRHRLSTTLYETRREHEAAYVGRLYVPTDEQQECEKRVHSVIRTAKYAREGAQDGLYVLGRSGVGKSTTVLRAAATYHRKRLLDAGFDPSDPDPRWNSDGYVSDFVPVVFITWRSSAKNKSITEQIATYLGYGSATTDATTNQVMGWGHRHGIGLLVGDDSRNIADGGKSADSIHNLLKNLSTELGFLNAAWIYIGIPDETGTGNLYANDQIDQRFEPFFLTDFDFDLKVVDETPANLRWSDYLAQWEKALAPVLPDMEPGHLSINLARRLWRRTQGSVGGLSGLLRRATDDVLEQCDPRAKLTLTRERLANTPMTNRFQGTPF